jgi:hypothetical protein
MSKALMLPGVVSSFKCYERQAAREREKKGEK